jgi:hypothetical protein
MNKDAFRWSIWHKGVELDYICGPDKEQVWNNFLQMSAHENDAELNEITEKWYYENLGYSVKESSIWMAKNAS